jgi:hypothetical protein
VFAIVVLVVVGFSLYAGSENGEAAIWPLFSWGGFSLLDAHI